MTKTYVKEFPDIDPAVAATAIMLREEVTVRAVDDAEHGTFYYLRIQTAVTEYESNDTELMTMFTPTQQDVLRRFEEEARAGRIGGEGIVMYDGRWNVCELSTFREEALTLLEEYTEYQKSIYPGLMIINRGTW